MGEALGSHHGVSAQAGREGSQSGVKHGQGKGVFPQTYRAGRQRHKREGKVPRAGRHHVLGLCVAVGALPLPPHGGSLPVGCVSLAAPLLPAQLRSLAGFEEKPSAANTGHFSCPSLGS